MGEAVEDHFAPTATVEGEAQRIADTFVLEADHGLARPSLAARQTAQGFRPKCVDQLEREVTRQFLRGQVAGILQRPGAGVQELEQLRLARRALSPSNRAIARSSSPRTSASARAVYGRQYD